MSSAPPPTPAGDTPRPAEPPVLRELRDAEQKVQADERAWHAAIRARDRLINQAYFEFGLRPFQIARATGVSTATVQGAVKDERARRAEAAETGPGPA